MHNEVPIASTSAGLNLNAGLMSTMINQNGASNTSTNTINGVRPFRSRKHRPCDLCRKRRARCAIPESGSACIECLQTNKPCTFLDKPVDRKDELARKRQRTAQADSLLQEKTASTSTIVPSAPPLDFNTILSHAANTVPPNGTGALHNHVNEASQNSPSQAGVEISPADNISLEISLEATATVDGLEPTAITALLTDDLLPVGVGAKDASQGIVTSHFQISSDKSKPTFFVLPDVPEYRRSRTTENDRLLLEHVHSAIDIVNMRTERLQDAYVSACHPAMPVLAHHSLSRLSDLPPALLAVINAKALEAAHDMAQLRRHVWYMIKQDAAGDNSLRNPTLSSLAVAILELSACPSLDSRNDYMLLAKLLGLHLASGRWRIPSWECELRERLWWSLRIHDAWMSFLHSRPSHIQTGNSNVPIPAVPAYLSRPDANRFASFSYNCRLSLLVNRLQTGLCLVERTGDASRNAKIRLCDSLQAELVILEDEIVPLVAANDELPGMANFQLLLYGFHCMVHRISIELRIGLGAAFLPDGQSLSIFQKFVDFIVKMPTRQGFWLPYASHVLSSVLSSLIRLSLAIVIHNAGIPRSATPNRAGINPVILISQLCQAILPSEGNSWEVAGAAAQRAHNVAERLRSIRNAGEADEYADLLEALQGNIVSEHTPNAGQAHSQPVTEHTAPPIANFPDLFPDPSFSWSNLDIWLSNLDGNAYQTFDNQIFGNQTFDNDDVFQTDYT